MLEYFELTGKINKEILVSNLDNYYDKMLPRYCKNYEVSYYFYNKEDESMCTSNYCNSIEVSVTAYLNLNYTYNRVMFYELKKGV